MDNEILLKLYSLYQKELYLYLYSFCGDRHLAEDLLHETFLKALLALPDGIRTCGHGFIWLRETCFTISKKRNPRRF